jgi:hypothetical protein
MSGLKINFHKNEIYCIGEARDNSDSFEQILNCNSSALPIKYLGVPINEKRLILSHRRPIEDKMGKKLCHWQGKMLVMGGRITLINSSLTSVVLYMLSFYSLPVGSRENMDVIRTKFLWGGSREKKKYNLVKWSIVCLPKDQGGLDILDVEVMNIAVLGKLLWKLCNEKGSGNEF